MPISGFLFAGPPVDESDVDALEHRLGVTLPPEYRRFLLRTNGGRPEPEDTFPFDPDDLDGSMMNKFFRVKSDDPYDTIARRREVFEGRVPPDLLAVGNDAGGSLVCIGIEGKRYGKVFFWDMESEKDWTRWGPSYGNVWEIAGDFDEFIEGFYEYTKEHEERDRRRSWEEPLLYPPDPEYLAELGEALGQAAARRATALANRARTGDDEPS